MTNIFNKHYENMLTITYTYIFNQKISYRVLPVSSTNLLPLGHTDTVSSVIEKSRRKYIPRKLSNNFLFELYL
jgi:hypothetical protein